MLKALIAGLVFGLPAGVSPGPTVALIISETLTWGAKSGIKVALAPLLTDPPIIALSLIAASGFAHTSLMRAGIDTLGFLYIAYLVWQTFFPKGGHQGVANRAASPFWKGVILNALNPNPYIFWFTVGAPMLAQLRGQRPIDNTFAFIAGFYSAFIGSKISIAVISGLSRRPLNPHTLSRLSRVFALTMLAFAAMLLVDAAKILAAR
jgi:threonine/homoserine/homoserine lactone efflux protein